MDAPTTRQLEVLDVIAKAEVPPTYREIADKLGVKSTNSVADNILALERKGCVSRQAGPSGHSQSRCLRVTEKGRQELKKLAPPASLPAPASPFEVAA